MDFPKTLRFGGPYHSAPARPGGGIGAVITSRAGLEGRQLRGGRSAPYHIGALGRTQYVLRAFIRCDCSLPEPALVCTRVPLSGAPAVRSSGRLLRGGLFGS
jgi:hypothetical protein